MHKRHPLSFIITILLAAVIALLAVSFFISMAKNSRLAREVASMQAKIDGYVKKSKIPISEESVALLTDERNALKSMREEFRAALISPLNEELAEKDLDPLQFKENLIRAQKKFREDAGNRHLSLPETLGFAKYETELSDPSDIPHLIRRLKVLEEVINNAASSKVESLDNIEFTDTKSSDGYFDIPLSFTMVCTASEFMDFLYKLRVSTFNFMVEKLKMEKIEEADAEEVARAKLKTTLSVKVTAFN